MAAYRADIEIGVKGVQQVQALTKQINSLASGVDSANKRLTGATQSINAYNANLAKAAATLNRVTAGTVGEAEAIRQYVQALGQANAARDRQNKLIQEQIALQRKAVPTANAGFGVQGPALPPAARGAAAGGRGRGRLGDIAGNAIIGGAFPLLFGQGGGAAAGGAIGGLIGGAFGGVGGFAGSLVGTVIGDIAAKGDKVRQLAEDIGFSAEQTKLLEQSFKQAGREFDNFEASVQAIRGVGLAINDQASAIQAASQLAETYGGKIDKITSAFAAALSSGKVTQATLNQLTKQGIPIQEKLAATYGVSRSQLLAMAKDGKISVQQLSDAFVSLANEASTGASAIPSAYETASRQIQQSVNELVSRVSAAFNVQTDNMVSAFDNAVSRIGAAISQLINRFAPLVETIAGLVAGFINLGTQAASALLAIPGYVDAVVNAVVLMIPGLSSTLYLLERIQQVTGGGKGAKTAADYGRYAPGFMQQAVPKPIPGITAPSQTAAGGGEKARKAKAEKDIAEQMQKQLEAAARMAVESDYELQISYQQTEQEKLLSKFSLERMERMNKFETLYKDALSNSEREYLVVAQTNLSLKEANEYHKQRQELLEDEVRTMYDMLGVSDILNKSFQRRLEGATGAPFRTDLNLDPNNKAIQTADDLKAKLTEITDKTYMAKLGAEGIGEAFSSAFQGIVTGTQTVQQALASFFRGVADAFISMATQIISQMLTMFVFKQLLGLFGGGGGGLFTGAGPVSGASAFTPGTASFNPAAFTGGFSLMAEGGFVTSPTRAVVGEGGEPEYVIPASKMRSAMGRYAAGARGSSVIPGNGETADTQDGNTATLAPIDVRYSVERINSVDYVTADQFRAGMAQAAQQGASRGEQATLRRLQQSTTTRRRIGL